VSVREVDKLSGGFAEPADVAAVVDRMETWSSLVFAFFDRRDAASAGGAQADGPAVR
jgi:hypothetical protein